MTLGVASVGVTIEGVAFVGVTSEAAIRASTPASFSATLLNLATLLLTQPVMPMQRGGGTDDDSGGRNRPH